MKKCKFVALKIKHITLKVFSGINYVYLTDWKKENFIVMVKLCKSMKVYWFEMKWYLFLMECLMAHSPFFK